MKVLRGLLAAALLPLALGLVIVTYQDAALTHIPARAVIADELRAGRIPFIHPGASCGQPLLGNPNFGVFFPDTVLALALPLEVAFGLRFAMALVLAFIGARRLAREEGAPPAAADIAALTFVLSGVFLSTWRFFNSGLALAVAPFVVAAGAKLARRMGTDGAAARRRAVAEMGLWIGLEVLAGEPVIALLTFALAETRAFVPALVNREHRSRLGAIVLGLTGAFALGGLVAAPQIAATAQILGDSSRERKPIPFVTATGTSVHPVRLVEQVVPFPHGRPDILGPGGFDGHRFFENHAPYLWTLHLGLVVLALLALHGRLRGPVAWFFSGAMVIALVLSQGRHLFGAKALYPFLSLGGRIRFPVKWWFVVAVALVPLVAAAAARWTAKEAPSRVSRILHAILVVAGAITLALYWPSTLLAAAGPAVSLVLAASLPWWPRRAALLGTAVAASLTLSSLPLLLALLDAPPPRPRGLGPGRLYSRIETEADAHPIAPPEATTSVRSFFRRAPAELWPLTATRVGTGYAFDFDPDGAYADEDRALRKALEALPWPDRAAELRIAGVTTVIADQPLPPPYAPLAVIDAERGVRAYTLDGAAPGVRVATRVLRASNLDAVMAAHRDAAFDPARDVVLEGPAAEVSPQAAEPGHATVVSESPAALVAEVDSKGAGVVVWSRTYFSAWAATIDGHPAATVRAEGHLVGVPVPAGRSRVEVRWRAAPVHIGLALSAVSLMLVIFLRRRG